MPPAPESTRLFLFCFCRRCASSFQNSLPPSPLHSPTSLSQGGNVPEHPVGTTMRMMGQPRALSAKHLPGSHEDPGLIPETMQKSLLWLHALAEQRWRQEVPWTLQASSPGLPGKIQVAERSCLRKAGRHLKNDT